MKHDVAISGLCFGLRPVCGEDADFIFALRSAPGIADYIHETPDLQSHRSWMQRYFARPGDYYFIVTELTTGTSQGTCALYSFDPDQRCAEWGRWIIKPGSLAAAESAYLSYSLAFERFQLDRVLCRTIASNSYTLAFHEACGLLVNRIESNAVTIHGRAYDIVEHMITEQKWGELKPALLRKCAAVSSILKKRTADARRTCEVLSDEG